MQVSENVDKCNYFLESVGRTLRHYRKENSWTQKQVAKKLSMATISYSLIERGKAGTTLKTLFNISRLLGVSPAQLLINKEEILLTKADVMKYCIQKENNL